MPDAGASEFSCRLRAAAVCLRGGRVLLVRHHPEGVAEPYWVPPGGGVRLGETLVDAALRELEEETGYAGEVAGVFGAREVFKQAGTVHEVFLRVGLAEDAPEAPSSPVEHVLKEARWLAPKDLAGATVYPGAARDWLADPDAHTTPLDRLLMPPVYVRGR